MLDYKINNIVSNTLTTFNKVYNVIVDDRSYIIKSTYSFNNAELEEFTYITHTKYSAPLDVREQISLDIIANAIARDFIDTTIPLLKEDT